MIHGSSLQSQIAFLSIYKSINQPSASAAAHVLRDERVLMGFPESDLPLFVYLMTVPCLCVQQGASLDAGLGSDCYS